MLRYLLVSTIIVLTVAVVVAGWINRDLIRIKMASVYAPVSPKPVPSNPIESSHPAALKGDAPWALSALPECLVQMSETTGPPAYTAAHLPAGSVPVRSPATLRYGDCTISVTGDEAFVSRGADRFRIPPRVRFYRTPQLLALLRVEGSGSELRVYQPPQQP
ncbi:MAG TPA: hypothetical protein VKB39_00445 [Candidatus Baltobacteraceae bacterium]|nr:hypothetical protein [Candidatus Baltobacteraceae bacterium]